MQHNTETTVQRKPYEAPALRRVAPMPLITAGSFDLFIPNP